MLQEISVLARELLALVLHPKWKTSQLWNSLAEAKVRAVESTECMGETQAFVSHKAPAYVARGQMETVTTLLSNLQMQQEQFCDSVHCKVHLLSLCSFCAMCWCLNEGIKDNETSCMARWKSGSKHLFHSSWSRLDSCLSGELMFWILLPSMIENAAVKQWIRDYYFQIIIIIIRKSQKTWDIWEGDNHGWVRWKCSGVFWFN